MAAPLCCIICVTPTGAPNAPDVSGRRPGVGKKQEGTEQVLVEGEKSYSLVRVETKRQIHLVSRFFVLRIVDMVCLEVHL